MEKWGEYITEIEIDGLWEEKNPIRWTLDRQVNVLSGINGVGKSTILNKIISFLKHNKGNFKEKRNGVSITVNPSDANAIRYDIIRSFDRPFIQPEIVSRIDLNLTTELDWQLFELQRKYLDYQVNIGNRIIHVLQKGDSHSAEEAQRIARPKQVFQDRIDELFADTGKVVVRSENELLFSMKDEKIHPYQLSSGEKQILVICLTVLIQDQKPCVLFMDEPEASLHIDWQKKLLDLILELNPAVQIVLTTHSPAVIMNGWIDKVTEVSEIMVDKA